MTCRNGFAVPFVESPPTIYPPREPVSAVLPPPYSTRSSVRDLSPGTVDL
jgi:hypothetical protein